MSKSLRDLPALPKSLMTGFNSMRQLPSQNAESISSMKRLSRVPAANPPQRTNTPTNSRLLSARRQSFSKSRTPQSSIAEMQPAYQSFNALCELEKALVTESPAQLLDPEFSRQFSRFSDAFDAFAKLTSSVMAAVNPQSIVEGRRTTSPLFRAGRELMYEFAGFIERVNEVSDSGISPHFESISASFDAIMQSVNNINASMKSQRYKTDAGGNVLAIMFLRIEELRRATNEVFETPRSRRFVDFDISVYEAGIKSIADMNAVLFNSALPLYLRKEVESTQNRVNIVSKCAEIVAVMKSAIGFDQMTTKLKGAVVKFNTDLSSLHKKLNLPFVIELTLEKPPKSNNVSNI